MKSRFLAFAWRCTWAGHARPPSSQQDTSHKQSMHTSSSCLNVSFAKTTASSATNPLGSQTNRKAKTRGDMSSFTNWDGFDFCTRSCIPKRARRATYSRVCLQFAPIIIMGGSGLNFCCAELNVTGSNPMTTAVSTTEKNVCLCCIRFTS